MINKSLNKSLFLQSEVSTQSNRSTILVRSIRKCIQLSKRH